MNALVTVTPTYAVSDLERMAVAFAGSKLFGVQTADQALALCLVAQAEGRHPASAAQDYHIISGRPAKKADAMLRDFIASGGKVEWHSLSDTGADATFSHPAGGTVRISWDHDRAKAAGINNPMWRKYPRQMLRSRVVSEGVRTVCPGATSGMYVPEEVQDFAPEQQVRDVTDEPDFTGTPQPPMPKSKARPEYERLCSELRAMAVKTEADLTAWYQENADAIGAQPNDWRAQLRTEYADTLKAIRQRAADPHGLFVEPPTGEDADDWKAYLDVIVGSIAGAPDAEQVAIAQTINVTGLAMCAGILDGVSEAIAIAAEQRMAALSAKAAA